MKFLITVLALILCVVLVTGLSKTGSLPGFSGGTTAGETTEETRPPDFATIQPVETDGMILARYSSDIPGFAATYETVSVGDKFYSEKQESTDTVSITLGSVSSGNQIAIGYSFSNLIVGQKYLLNYYFIDLAESFSLTKYYFRQGTVPSFMELAMPDLINGCVFFTATSTSVDFILMIIDRPSQENLSSFARFIEESTLFGISEVVEK